MRAEILTVLCDYESTSESMACVLLFGSETKSTAWYIKLLPSVHKSKFILSLILLHFLLYNFNTAVPNLDHILVKNYILDSILGLKLENAISLEGSVQENKIISSHFSMEGFF